MKVTDFTREALKTRRYRRKMRRAGYRYSETDLEIVCGGRYDEVIVDVQIDIARRGVWTKIGPQTTS